MAYRPENPVGSTSAKDLMANAENFDLLALGENSSYLDRKGVPRKSWTGMEREFNSRQTNREAQFAVFLESSGYEAPVPYATGLTLERTTQVVTFQGKEYRVKSEYLPLETLDWTEDESKLKLIGDYSLRQQIANSTDPSKGAGLVMVEPELEYAFGSAGFALSNTTQLKAGGNPIALPVSESVDFFDPLTRSLSKEILPGSPVGIFDNNTTYGLLFGTGRYIQDSNGITKISGTGSAVLMLPVTYGGDIDMEISMRSLYQVGTADANAPQDASLALLLRVQDEKNYCIVQVNNSHLLSASLSVRESVDGDEKVRATYGNIVINEASPKMSNTWPTLRVVLRKNRVTVSLNGVRVLSNIVLQNQTWGRHGIRVYKQGTVIRDFKIRSKTPQVAPSAAVIKEGLLYGDGLKYVGWADAEALSDGSVFMVWRESNLDTPSGGHQQGGRVVGAKWRDGRFITTPVTHFEADGPAKTDYQEQDCVLSKVHYNGNEHLVMFTRRFLNTPSTNKCYVNYCNLGINDPADPSRWPTRTEVAFPGVLQFVIPHAKVLMAADGANFISAFYGVRVGHTAYACVLASSTDLVNWTVKSIPIDPLGASNPITGGDPEPALLRGPGASLLLYARARTLVSHDDGLTWCQYDLLGGNGNRGRHFPSAIRTEKGAFLMYRRYTNAVTPADSVLVPLRINDGISWKSADFLGGITIGTQYYGAAKPGKANPGGDSGCLRAAYLGGDKYLLLDYRQRVDEMAPRLYQYIISAS